jgi:HrpA-like RNA helicase
MNTQEFADYFGVSESLDIKGTGFPLEIQHPQTPTPDYAQLALSVVKHIHEKKAPGNILDFLYNRFRLLFRNFARVSRTWT